MLILCKIYVKSVFVKSAFICRRLVRLPRCLGRMPSLTSISASLNQLTYLPTELCNSKTLRRIRANNNMIGALPGLIGKQVTLLISL